MAPVRVKVCGITNLADACHAAHAGADWIGLNFHAASPRAVDFETARTIAASLPASTLAVGVFVNRTAAEVAGIAARVGLSLIQLHGDEPPEDLAALRHLQVIRAFRLGAPEAVDRMLRYLSQAAVQGAAPYAVLIDAGVPGLWGGTGRTIDDRILSELPALPRLILAGGLTPENVAERIAQVRPWMVDVAGGVEATPGRKDPAKVTAFVRAAKG